MKKLPSHVSSPSPCNSSGDMFLCNVSFSFFFIEIPCKMFYSLTFLLHFLIICSVSITVKYNVEISYYGVVPPERCVCSGWRCI